MNNNLTVITPDKIDIAATLGGDHAATTKRAVCKELVRSARCHQELLLLLLSYRNESWTHNHGWWMAVEHIARQRAVDLGWDAARWERLVEKTSKVDPHWWRQALRGDFSAFPGRAGEWLAEPPPTTAPPPSYCNRMRPLPLPVAPPAPARPQLRLIQGGRAG